MSEETTNEGATATQATPASAPTDAIETAPCYCCGSRRGVPTGRAERLVVRGFFDEVLDGLALGSLEDVVRASLEAKLERTMP